MLCTAERKVSELSDLDCKKLLQVLSRGQQVCAICAKRAIVGVFVVSQASAVPQRFGAFKFIYCENPSKNACQAPLSPNYKPINNIGVA